MRVLLAVDRVGVLPAADVASALVEGWRGERPGDLLTPLPLSDGSAGMLPVVPGATREVVVVPGPLGDDVPATLARTGATCWIDADEVLGPHLVGERRGESLERGSSAGLGQLIGRAVASGATRVVVGLGIAGVHDAGAGLVSALASVGDASDSGAPDRTVPGGVVPAGGVPGGGAPGGGSEAERAARVLAGVDVVLALAVDEPLTGLHGAGAQLAERFGIDPVLAQDLDRRTGVVADAVLRDAGPGPRRSALPMAGQGMPAPRGHAGQAHAGHSHAGQPHAGHSHAGDTPSDRLTTRTDGGGAGGGAALALRALGARAFDGGEVVATELGLDDALDRLDGVGLVVTSATEVGPDEARRSVMAVVGRRAAERALPVVAVGRTVSSSRRELAPSGVSATASLTPGRHPDEDPRADDPAALREALVDRGARLARTWSRP